MPGISSLILKLVSPCNLNCRYCYIYNHEDQSYRSRPRLMSEEIFDATLRRVEEYCQRHYPRRVSLVFHGGEPTLMPVEQFDHLVTKTRATLRACLGRLSIQTNATLIDDAWVRVLRRHDVSVGVSLDGPPQIHDAVRVDHANRGSHARTMWGIHRMQAGGVTPKILCVVNPGTSGVEAYRHFRSQGITWMNFLLPDVSRDNKERRYGEYGATPVADYLIPIFDEWFAEDNPRVIVALFWELLQSLMGGPSSSDCFGNPLMSYVIVETDGSIEALDALRVCADGMTASGLNVLRNGFDDLSTGAPLAHRAVHVGFPLCSTCSACEFATVCGGGYLPHRYARLNGFDNPSAWCDDILAVLRHIQSVAVSTV
jgi:uncharacterized protein